MLTNDREFRSIGGLERCKAIQSHADQGGGDRLMRSAFGRYRHTRRDAHDQETGILIARIVQRIEAAAHTHQTLRRSCFQPS